MHTSHPVFFTIDGDIVGVLHDVSKITRFVAAIRRTHGTLHTLVIHH
jgi:hypothetical protein